jgi:acyl-CoA thioesterase-1
MITFRNRRTACLLRVLGLTALALAAPERTAYPQEQPLEILAFGDSLTAGFGLHREVAFPARLQEWLKQRGWAVRVINAGVSGETTTAGLARLPEALVSKPDLVILELGTNDALRGVQPNIVRANLEQMIERIRATGAAALLTGVVAPAHWGKEYAEAFDRIFPELAQQHGLWLYPSFLQDVAQEPHLNQSDRLHPNEAGVAVLVDHIGPVVVRLVTQVGPRVEEHSSTPR